MSTSIATPNNTLYVSNIDWKIKKPQLKRGLYMLFTRHGKVRFIDYLALLRSCFIRACMMTEQP